MSDKAFPEVSFSAAQLQLVEKMFPHVSYNYDASEAKLRHHHGQQSVVDFIRRRTRGVDPNRPNYPPAG